MNVWRVRDDLFIRGRFDNRPDKLQELRDLGVDVVVCMLRKTDPDLEGLDWLDYRSFPLPDTDTVAEAPLHHAAFHVVRSVREGRTVLVHCIGARDRAPTTAALALTMLEGISGSEAMMRIKQLKPTTFTNQAFVRYLNNIEAPA